MNVSAEELRAFSQYVQQLTGITLGDGKGYLLESRLAGMLAETGSASFGVLLARIKADASRRLERQLVDRITTGETLFFRDQAPFELLAHKLLPELIDRRSASKRPGPIPIRIWSAACSNGQEVYSIAMTLRELLGGAEDRYQIRILGTDISDQAVATASRGVYNRIEIERGLTPEKLRRYFTPEPDGGYRIRDELRAMATFRTQNLLADFTALGRHDIVFCRNVAIYFSEPDRIALFTRLCRSMEPDGCLLIGATESLAGLCPPFMAQRYLRSIYYQVARA